MSDSPPDTLPDAADTDATPDNTTPGRFVCPDCDKHVTRGPNGTEYGHARYSCPPENGEGPSNRRCPRRPDTVDPEGGRDAPAHLFGDEFDAGTDTDTDADTGAATGTGGAADD
jgi:hypothetical protein